MMTLFSWQLDCGWMGMINRRARLKDSWDEEYVFCDTAITAWEATTKQYLSLMAHFAQEELFTTLWLIAVRAFNVLNTHGTDCSLPCSWFCWVCLGHDSTELWSNGFGIGSQVLLKLKNSEHKNSHTSASCPFVRRQKYLNKMFLN